MMLCRLFILSTIIASLPLLCMASVDIYYAENIPKLEPEITSYVEKTASANDESGMASVYVSSMIRGDIDGDKEEDIFVSFAVEGIGGGNFSLFFQALFLKKDNTLVLEVERDNGSFGLATGSSFIALSIAHGNILGYVLEYAEGDGVCCPSIKRSAKLIYKNGELVEWFEKE